MAQSYSESEMKSLNYGDFDKDLWALWESLKIPIHYLYIAELELKLFGRQRAYSKLMRYAKSK